MRKERLNDDEMLEVLKMISPGTVLREGLENILKARTGGLIVIGDSKEVMDIIDGGFTIHKEFSPAHLYELAKMDGAIVLSKDTKRILCANALLIPNPLINTNETGTRHKSAERVAKQTNEVVISISERRNIITIYKGVKKYILRETHIILTRANQALQTLEKYKVVLDNFINNLSVLEFEDTVTLEDVAVVIQRAEMVMRIVAEIDRYLCELGNEGRLISMQLEELLSNIEEDCMFVIEDYMVLEGDRDVSDIQRQLRYFSDDELIDFTTIIRFLGFAGGINALNLHVSPRGYRILNRIPRVPLSVVKNMVEKFNDFQGILNATIDELDDVDGIGEVRAKVIKSGLIRIQEQLLLDNRRI